MMQDVSIQLSSRARFVAGFLVGIGVVGAVYGVMIAPERTWPNLLLNGFYIASVGVSAMLFLGYTTRDWRALVRQFAESAGGIHFRVAGVSGVDRYDFLRSAASVSMDAPGRHGRRTGFCRQAELPAAAMGVYARSDRICCVVNIRLDVSPHLA